VVKGTALANRTKKTDKKGDAFIQSLIATGGNVSEACKAESIGRTAAYRWRNDDPEFASRWDAAVEVGVDQLETEARRRAFKGVKKPVYQGGKLVGHIQEYSDTLLIFLLKGNRKEKYSERSTTINLNFTPEELTSLTDEQLDDLIKRHCK